MMTPDPLPCTRCGWGCGILSRKKRRKGSPDGPSGAGIPGKSPTGATLVTWMFTTVGPSCSANAAKEPGIVDALAATAAFWPSPWATDVGVHCMLDDTSKPAKSEDSATLATALAPNRPPAMYCLH